MELSDIRKLEAMGIKIYQIQSGLVPGWATDEIDGSKVSEMVERVVFDTSFKEVQPSSMAAWFAGMTHLTTIEGWENLDTSKVNSMLDLFNGCSSMQYLNLSTFDTSNVRDMRRMFYGCSGLIGLTLYVREMHLGEYNEYQSTFTTKSVYYMDEMFAGCASIKTLILPNFDLSSLKTSASMFAGNVALDYFVGNLEEVILPSTITLADDATLSSMFEGCMTLKSLDLSMLQVKSGISTSSLLANCSALEQLTVNASMNALADNACTGVGTKEKPCLLKMPAGFEPDVTETGDGYFVWKGGYFTNTILLGDANSDGKVTVADVMMTVSQVLGKKPASFSFVKADVNNDNKISVADVMQIVKIVIRQ